MMVIKCLNTNMELYIGEFCKDNEVTDGLVLYVSKSTFDTYKSALIIQKAIWREKQINSILED